MDPSAFDALVRGWGVRLSRRQILAAASLMVTQIGSRIRGVEASGPEFCTGTSYVCYPGTCMYTPDGTFGGCCDYTPCYGPGKQACCGGPQSVCCGGVCCQQGFEVCARPGECAAQCPDDTTSCGDYCCDASEACQGETCVAACSTARVGREREERATGLCCTPPEMACGDHCCTADEVCFGGTCSAVCPPGTTACGRTCCAASQGCQDGVCAPCPDPLLPCNGHCVLPCGPGLMPNGSTCACECPGDECGSKCCPAGEVCVSHYPDTCCPQANACGFYCDGEEGDHCCKMGPFAEGGFGCGEKEACCGKGCCPKATHDCHKGRCVKKPRKHKHHKH